MIDRPSNLEDRIGGKVQIEHYVGGEFEMEDCLWMDEGMSKE